MTIRVQACICLRFLQIGVTIIAKLVRSSGWTTNTASDLLVHPHWGPKIETTRISEHIQVRHRVNVVTDRLLVFERLNPCTCQQRRSEKTLVWFDARHRSPLTPLEETASSSVLIVKICVWVLIPFAERFSPCNSLRGCKEWRLANWDQVWLQLVLVVCIAALRGLIIASLLLTLIQPELIALLAFLLKNLLLILVGNCVWIIGSVGVKLCSLRGVLRLIVRLLRSSYLLLLAQIVAVLLSARIIFAFVILILGKRVELGGTIRIIDPALWQILRLVQLVRSSVKDSLHQTLVATTQAHPSLMC